MEDGFTAELAAMQEIGQRRSRLRLMVAFVAFPIVCVALWSLRYVIGLHIGVLYIAIAAAPLAGTMAVAVVAKLTPGIIKDTADKHGIPVDKLSQDEFIIN